MRPTYRDLGRCARAIRRSMIGMSTDVAELGHQAQPAEAELVVLGEALYERTVTTDPEHGQRVTYVGEWQASKSR
jgi:hypothetical protein